MGRLNQALEIGLLALFLIAGAGCKKAGHFGRSDESSGTKKETAPNEEKLPRPSTEKVIPLARDLAWIVPSAAQLKEIEPAVPIRFVYRGQEPEKWSKLNQAWTLVKRPRTPLNKEVQMRVPLGLPDPTPHIPAANPPTAGKWALGKKLFFDNSYLWPPTMDAQSCATCHNPARGFTEGTFPGAGKMRAPTLFNVVYNTSLFWDGRARALERVVQRSLEDEREPNLPNPEQIKDKAERRHLWSGVVTRLRAKKDYAERFKKVFGTPPTQDNIGKALATYLRTILIGNSIYDRAWLAAGGKVPLQDRYAALLSAETMRALGRADSDKDKVAAEIFQGYRIFHGAGHCVRCHNGPNFTDNDFHNAGIRESQSVDPAKPVGRFALLPVGLKDSRFLGAFKTPTLRGLPRTAPYFHDGSAGSDKKEDGVFDAVAKHVSQRSFNPHLDPSLRELKLPETDVRAVALFLRCLDGTVDPVVSDNGKWPDGTRP